MRAPSPISSGCRQRARGAWTSATLRSAHRRGRALSLLRPQRPAAVRRAARDLRARLRSYLRSDRQRPAVEAAVGAVERIEWRVLGSELEASLEELRLIRELRPPANARVARPEAPRSGFASAATASSRRRSRATTRCSGRSARAAARSSRRAHCWPTSSNGRRGAAAAAPAPRRARRRAPLQGRRAPARPAGGARARLPRARAARPPARGRALHRRAGRRARPRAGLLRRRRPRRRRADAAARRRRLPGDRGRTRRGETCPGV